MLVNQLKGVAPTIQNSISELDVHGDDVNQSNEKDEDASEAGNELVSI